MQSMESYAQLLTAVLLILSHVLKIMPRVPQSLEEQRDILSVNSPLTFSSGLIFSSALARKGGLNV